jgi:parvulin-like peptidyl-prolyl isomerase
MVENSLYRTKLQDILKADVPTTGDQVHARHILLKTKEEAEAALVRLRNGEDFTKLAAELSQDTSNKDQGGDLGWFSRGDMVAEFDNVVFSLQPGQLSDVVETEFGAHIIRVDERDPNHPLDASALQRAQSAAIQDWFTRQRAVPEVVRKWDSTMVPKDLPTPSARNQ